MNDNMIKKADIVLKEIEKQTSKKFLPILSYLTPKKKKFMEDLVRKHKPKRILEIGTLVGYSAILMAKNTRGKIITIEINPNIAKEATKNIQNAGFEKKIKIINSNALTAIPKLKGKFDFVFIDAAKDEYLQYLLAVEKKLSKNAVIVADNTKIFADAMQDYLNYVRYSKKYENTAFDFGSDGMEVSVKKN